MEVPGLGQPSGVLPVGVAAVARPATEGGPSGPTVLLTALAVRQVVRQAVLPGLAA